MAISYPAGLDALTNPTATDKLNSPDHATQHANLNDIAEALEAKLGADSSAVGTSIDYFLKHASGSYRTHTHDDSSDDGSNIPEANVDFDISDGHDHDGVNSKAITAGTSFWTNVPGTPTRVSDTQFTITDTANANLYDLIFKKGVILKWLESTTFQTAMVISSSYAANNVTVNIVGNSLTAAFTEMKYCLQMAQTEVFIIPGTLPAAATANIAKTWWNVDTIYPISADLRVGTAGSGVDGTIVDINDDGTTMFTTKPTITTTGTSDINNVSDNLTGNTVTAVEAASAITVDVDDVTATAAPVDAYVMLYYYPVSWRYRS